MEGSAAKAVIVVSVCAATGIACWVTQSGLPLWALAMIPFIFLAMDD